MTDLQRRLVELYATGPVEGVHITSAYQALCREHEGDRAFDGEREMIENLRIEVEDWIGKRTSYREQIEFGLRLLAKLPKPPKPEQEICRELILRIYGRRWEAMPRAYFEEKSLFIAKANAYFLSFTNRNPGRPNLNQVNRNHEWFIKDVLGQDAYDRADRSEQNLLAEAVHYLLTNRRLVGFYYPKHLGDNTEVEAKLRDNCTRAFAFVQLVQDEIFRYFEGARNWCHFEYGVARDTGADRILFLQVDQDIREGDIFHDFDPWYRMFASKDPLRLRWTRWQDPAVIDENFEMIRNTLTEQIDRSIKRVYEGIPN
jgi:hypothetical protein